MVVRNLTDRGLILKKGTIVDSTIISAPTSTKNKEKKRDPDAHSVKKGTTWYFGYRAHIGVDKDTGLVHHVKVTAANVSDVKMTSALLMGDEEEVYGDSGYLGAEKQSDAIIRNRQGKKIRYKQNRKPSQIKKLSESGQRKARKAEHEKSSVRGACQEFCVNASANFPIFFHGSWSLYMVHKVKVATAFILTFTLCTIYI